MADLLIIVGVWILGAAMLAGLSAIAAFGIVYFTGLSMGPAFLIALGFFILISAVSRD